MKDISLLPKEVYLTVVHLMPIWKGEVQSAVYSYHKPVIRDMSQLDCRAPFVDNAR